jgi:hypothetical protein
MVLQEPEGGLFYALVVRQSGLQGCFGSGRPQRTLKQGENHVSA